MTKACKQSAEITGLYESTFANKASKRKQVIMKCSMGAKTLRGGGLLLLLEMLAGMMLFFSSNNSSIGFVKNKQHQ